MSTIENDNYDGIDFEYDNDDNDDDATDDWLYTIAD